MRLFAAAQYREYGLCLFNLECNQISYIEQQYVILLKYVLKLFS